MQNDQLETLPGTIEEEEFSPLCPISDELHDMLEAAGIWKEGIFLFEQQVLDFADKYGDDAPARLLAFARDTKEKGASLLCILWDLHGKGKDFTPFSLRFEPATINTGGENE